MANVEDIHIESDERGWELHLTVGDDIRHHDDGRLILNIHMVAEQLLRECVQKIGPWLLEGAAAAREHARTPSDPYEDEDSGPWPGESVMAFYQRTGQDGPLRDVADAMNKARKENP